jgi:hypothetical protein
MTGAMALENELRYSLGLGYVGRDLNNEMYTLYKSNPNEYFYDITQSNNTLFDATKGFDLATGMGAPNFNNLIPGLAGAQAPTTGNVSSVADQYQSLTSPQGGNSITPFSGSGIAQISNQFISLTMDYTNFTTISSTGSTITIENTATVDFPVIGRSTNNSFSADGTATVINNGVSATYQIEAVGKVTGTPGHFGIKGQFFTIDSRGRRVNPGAISVFQGSFQT